MEIDIVIDSLTNCLVCNKTGKELDTEFKEIIVDSVLATKLNQEGWKFDWSKPAKEGYTLLALYIKDDKKNTRNCCYQTHSKRVFYTSRFN